MEDLKVEEKVRSRLDNGNIARALQGEKNNMNQVQKA